MRNIPKEVEPVSLTQHRCNQHTDYNNYADKDDLREALVSEQQGICCYCMRRIRPAEADMKIEHWHAQSPNKYPEEQLDYGNLLGACRGGHGKRKKDQHCDTRKGDADLTFNPANPAHNVEAMFRFPGSGRIEAFNNDQGLQAQLEDILNLNHSTLIKNRKAVLDSFTAALTLGKARDCDLPKRLKEWDGSNSGLLEPFSQVIVYYLRKKLKTA